MPGVVIQQIVGSLTICSMEEEEEEEGVEAAIFVTTVVQ